MYDKLIEKLRDDSILENCEFDFAHKYMHEAADAIEELQKDLERSKDFEAFWQHEAEEALKKFQVAISNKPRWIPVTERLPDHRTTCLIVDDGVVAVGWRNLIGEWYDVAGDRLKYVTHWMPLPKPPKDGEE